MFQQAWLALPLLFPPAPRHGAPAVDPQTGPVPTQPESQSESIGVQKPPQPELPEEIARIVVEIDAAIAAGDLETARGILRETVASLRALELDSDETEIALLVALDGRGQSLHSLAELATLREALVAARTRLLPPDHPELLAAKQSLGATRYALGDLEGARELFEEILEVRARVLPPEHPDLLKSKMNVATARKSLGVLEGVRELEEGALEAWSHLVPPEHPDALRAKLNLAATKKALGDFAGARELEVEALEVCARVLQPDDPQLLAAKQKLAETRYALGDLAGARELFEAVLESERRRLPPENPGLLIATQNLAATRYALGDLTGARELFEGLLETWSRSLPPEHPDLLLTKLNLAATRKALGDLSGARELEVEVLEVRSQLLPPEHPELLATKLNVARTKRSLGDLEGALELEEEVLEAWTLLPPEHPDVLSAKQNLALTRTALGDLAGARELEEEVLETRMRVLPPGHRSLLDARQNLAATLYALGDLAGARALELQVLEGIRARARSSRTDSPRAARERARGDLQRLFELRVSREASDPDQSLHVKLFETVESLRLVAVSGPDVTLAIEDRPALAELRDRIAGLRASIADVGSSVPGAEALEAWRERMRELTRERDSAEYELRRELTEAGGFAGEVEAAALAARLGNDDLAVSYLRYPRPLRPRSDGEGPRVVDSLLAFVVRPGGRVQRVELGPAGEIEELVATWRTTLDEPLEARGVGRLQGPGADGDDAQKERDAGRALRARVLDPVLAQVDGDGPRRIHLVPDDALHLVPFAALPAEGGGRLGDELDLRQEVSFGRLLAPPRPPASAGRLVALGGIDFDSPAAAGATGEDGGEPPRPASLAAASIPPVSERSGLAASFAPLLQTGGEVEAVAARFEERYAVEPVLLEGKDATKEALAVHAPHARYLHVATHGWFASEAVRSQLDELSGAEERAVLDGAAATLRGLAPETLCGLALAGANLGPDAVGRVPGILTAEELASLDLRACELAVLSACETNVGVRRAGQGIQSLQSALHAAGARTAITSLWKVDDAATRRLMELFYAGLWSDGLGKADALWRAKTALREEGHPVRAWAAWVLTGDPD